MFYFEKAFTITLPKSALKGSKGTKRKQEMHSKAFCNSDFFSEFLSRQIKEKRKVFVIKNKFKLQEDFQRDPTPKVF